MRDFNLEGVDGTIIYIGAGVCPELDELLASEAERIVLLEPQAGQAHELRARAAHDHRVEIISSAVGPRDGTSSLRSFSIPGMDCLEGLSPNTARFPGLLVLKEEDVSVVNFGTLLESRCMTSRQNLLIVDVAGAEALLVQALPRVETRTLAILLRIDSTWQHASLSKQWSEVLAELGSVGYRASDFSADGRDRNSAVFSSCSETNIPRMFFEKRGKLIDKWSSYLYRYSEILAPRLGSVRRLLEIGVQNGGSMDVWRQTFPNLELAVGVDIDEKCGDLVYEDPRIHIVVGPAETSETVQKVLDLSREYDLVIDDGSHVSFDVIRNFFAFFPMLVDSGVYVVEDVHASYWEKFGGGLTNKNSQMSFFKSLTDVINYEHWSELSKMQAVFPDIIDSDKLRFLNIEQELKKISEIRFYNSMVFIFKGYQSSDLGQRIVRGTEAKVTDMDWHKRVGEGASVTAMQHKAVW